jgi:ketosteroid isomerase-like protein
LLQDDVTFVGPMGATQGAQDYVDGIERMGSMVSSARQTKLVVEGDDVCIMYDLVTDRDGAVPAVGWYHFRDGKIDSVHAYFDPSPLATKTAPPGMPLFAASLQVCGDAL